MQLAVIGMKSFSLTSSADFASNNVSTNLTAHEQRTCHVNGTYMLFFFFAHAHASTR